MSGYLKSLAADLPRWVGLGYVSEQNAALILKDAEARQGEGWFRLPLILSMLGGILVFTGVISLVASNWDFMPRSLKLVTLIGGMGLAFLSAYYARSKGSEGLSHGLAFLGSLMFGANLMLIGQIYHLPPNPAGGSLLWALGAALVAVVWPSQLVCALALLLTGLWSWFCLAAGSRDIWFFAFDTHRVFPHWQFFILWGALTMLAVRRNWNKALHLSGLTLTLWCFLSTVSIWGDEALRFGGLLLAVLLLVMHLSGEALKLARAGSGTISRYLWVGYALWLLFISIPEMQRDLLLAKDAVIRPYLLGGAGGLLALALYGMAKTGYRAVAAAFAIGSVVLLLSVSESPTDYTYVYDYSLRFGGVTLIVLAVLTLLSGLGAILHGYRNNERFFINLGFTLFSIKLFWIYFDTVWKLNGRAMFLMLGGLLVIGLGIFFDRQRRRLIARMQKGVAS